MNLGGGMFYPKLELVLHYQLRYTLYHMQGFSSFPLVLGRAHNREGQKASDANAHRIVTCACRDNLQSVQASVAL
jgi:hypothetical protein